MSDRDVKRSILLFYLMRVFGAGIMFTIPSFMPFLREHGMGFAGVAALEFAFGCVAFSLDAPTGKFADLFGRRVSLLIGRLFLALGCFAYSQASHVPHLFSAEVLIAVGLAFSLGADEAFLRSLFPRSKEGDAAFSRVLGKSLGIDLMSGAAAMYYGPALYRIDPSIPFMVATVCYLTAAIIVLLMREPKRERSENEKIGVLAATRHCSESPILRELILFQAVVGFFLGATMLLQEPYLRYTKVSESSDGLIFALFGVAAGMGTFLAPRLSQKLSLPTVQCLVFGALASGLVLLGIFRSTESFLFIVLLQLVRGVHPIVVSRPFNAAVGEEIRATALSVKSMCFRIGDWSGKTLGLLLAAGLGVPLTLLVLGMFALSVMALVSFRMRSARGPSP